MSEQVWMTSVLPASYASHVALWTCDRYGNKIERIPVRYPHEATLEASRDAKVHKRLTIGVNDPFLFDPYRDYVTIELAFINPDGSYVLRKGEAFIVVGMTETVSSSARSAGSIVCEDVTTIAARYKPSGTVIDTDVDTGAAARQILIDAGLGPIQVSIPDTGLFLPETYRPEPRTSALDIAAHVLEASGYHAPWYNDGGRVVTDKLVPTSRRQPLQSYGIRDGLRLIPPIQSEPDWSNVVNTVTVRSTRASDDEEDIWATARIENRSHPLYFDPNDSESGIELSGDPIDVQDVVSEAAALEIAKTKLSELVGLNHRLTISSIADVRADMHQTVHIQGEALTSRFSGEWLRTGWTTAVRGVTSTTQSSLIRVEDIE